MAILVIGAGLAGLTCATALQAAGLDVAIDDKGRAPGGRMSTRRVGTGAGDASFDHGAQYFTVRDPAFAACVERWQAEGLAAPWPAAGPDAWVGTPGMNAPLRQLAQALDVRSGVAVDALGRHGGQWQVAGRLFDSVLVAVPAEQAAPLLRPWDAGFADAAATTRSAPCWTAMAAFAARVPFDADVLRESGPIGWAARNSAKPGRTGPESWVVQAGPDWSRAHLEDPADEIRAALLEALADRAGAPLPPLLTAAAHRWRYARSGSAGASCLWNPALRLGVCGDWLIGPRVEAAWRSGRLLALAVIDAIR